MLINIPDHILFEDAYVLVVNKPSGLMVEPDRNGNPSLLQHVKSYLSSKSDTKEIYAQHIHRLDRPVSGIVLFAKQREVLRNLSEQFAERKVKKFYQALTESCTIDHKGILENWHRKEKKKAVIYNEDVQWAERVKLEYKIDLVDNNKYLWSIQLHTGKYHQIRAQLAFIDCPILGDALYGSAIGYKLNTIALHAYKLIFFHPISNEEIVIENRINLL